MTNGWINERTIEFITHPWTPEGQAQVRILGWSLMLHSNSADSQERLRAIIPLVVDKNLSHCSPSNLCDFCCFLQRAIQGVHRLCNHRCVVQARCAYAMSACVRFVSSMSGILFKPCRCNHWPQPINEGHTPTFYVPAPSGGHLPLKANTRFT